MFYVLIEWDGKGSGKTVLTSYDKKEVLSERECVLTQKQAKQKYHFRYFYQSDVKCSEIQIFKSYKSYANGKNPINSKFYY